MTSADLYTTDPLIDDDLTLVLAETQAQNPRHNGAPTYGFELRHTLCGQRMGSLSVRAADTEYVVQLIGHIGYGVSPEFRGHRYAARASRLVLPVLAHHRIDPVWITCNPDNIPSRRTCEILGATLVDIVPVPPDSELYRFGDREKCRYRLDLSAEAP